MDEPFSINHPVLSKRRPWKLPDPADFLEPACAAAANDAQEVRRNSEEIETLLRTSNVAARVVQTLPGPRLTQYWVELKAERGRGVTNPLRYIRECRQGVGDVYYPHTYWCRVTVPIPGRPLAIFEIANDAGSQVQLRQVIYSQAFQSSAAPLKVAMGVDVAGQPVVADLAGMQHLLVAGMTGQGKSVFVDGLILSLLLTRTPDELRLVMITDGVELAPYRSLPHLLSYLSDLQEHKPKAWFPPSWYEQGKEIMPLLRWLEQECDRRLALLAGAGCADLEAYNRLAREQKGELLPRIVIFHEHFFIYELHLIQPDVPPLKEVEPHFTRLAQTAHAAGIHLVVTNSIVYRKNMSPGLAASFPARACFAMNNPDSSRRALGVPGAEGLLGAGDYLYRASATAPLVRLQACHTTWDEARRVVQFWKEQAESHPAWRD